MAKIRDSRWDEYGVTMDSDFKYRIMKIGK